MFQRNNSLLDQIQKCLEDYLESKRMVFSRFYFLSNDELLEILSQTRNPQAVQPHMRKCFDAIQKLDFATEKHEPAKFTNDILAMISPEGESVSLGKGLKARGNVEVWLCSVEDAMVKSLRALTKAAVSDFFTRPRTEWVSRHASQVRKIMANQAVSFSLFHSSLNLFLAYCRRILFTDSILF
jgi:dynein heavy chain